MTTGQTTGELVVSDNLKDSQLSYTNKPQNTRTFQFEPASFSLHLSGPDLSGAAGPEGALLVEIGSPGGLLWGSAKIGANQLAAGYDLNCTPTGNPPAPGSLLLNIAVKAASGGNTLLRAQHSLTMVWIGHSGFDPAVNGYNFVNSGSAYGAVSIDRAVFDRTYGLLLGREKFFRKMYRDILGATVDEKGPIAHSAPLSSGLCTGMIRSTLAFYLKQANPPAHQLDPVGDTLNTIKLYHGRQLTDKALFQAAGWIIRGGPRKVFEVFKKEVLSGNKDPLAFDIGIATLKRKNFFTAIQSEGHTVVPYAFRQSSPQSAEIFIYNPNIPASQENYGYANAPAGEEARLTGPVINFDLANNKYFYTDHYQSVRPNGDPTTIVAVHQSAYEKGRSAIITSIANNFI
ncbi:MAG TPA: hypothetical protein VH186_06810 [Chloroflexia bacterium]|nr:hypothetical protein [Chloroflexia bacterium]